MRENTLLVMAWLSALLVFADAWRARQPYGWAWALAVFGFWIVALPVYVIVRIRKRFFL